MLTPELESFRRKRAELTVLMGGAGKADGGPRASPGRSCNKDNFFAGVAPLGVGALRLWFSLERNLRPQTSHCQSLDPLAR